MLLTTFRRYAFRPPVEVVQPDARRQPGRRIEKFARQRLAQRIVPLLLPPADQIVSLLGDHPVELRNLIGRILQIGVHRNHDFPPGGLETAVERGRLAVVAAKPDAPHMRIADLQPADRFPRSVAAAVVDEHDLVRKTVLAHDAHDPLVQLGKRLLFVIKRNHDGYVDSAVVFHCSLSLLTHSAPDAAPETGRRLFRPDDPYPRYSADVPPPNGSAGRRTTKIEINKPSRPP